MKAMDEEMSADDDDLVPAIVADVSRPADNRSPTIVRSNSASRTVPNSPSLQDAPSVAQDVSGGSLSTLTASSDFDAIESRTPPVSPPPAASHRRGKRRAVIHSSDEDTEDDTQGSARRSRPSSTPPTSDNDLPAQIPLPASSRTQVPPLRFNNELAVGHRKRPSDTGPSKTKAEDKLETIRDRGRIAGGQRAAVQHASVSGDLSLGKFWKTLQADKTAPLARTATAEDPISSRVANASAEKPLLEPMILPALDQSDDEMPAVGDLLDQMKQEEAKAELQRELAARKLKLAAATRRATYANESDDDDLEITGPSDTKAKDVFADRGSGSKQKPSEGRKRQLALGGITLRQQREKQNPMPEQLNKEMAKRVAQSNAELTKKKEDEWVRTRWSGGTVGGSADESARSNALKTFTEKGQKNAEAREARMQVAFDEEDDASDEDWIEDRGSASPRAQQDSDGNTEDADITMVNPDDDEDEEMGEDAENEAPLQVKRRGPRHSRAIVDSESENDENDENAAPLTNSASGVLRERRTLQEDEILASPMEHPAAAIRHGSTSSTDERTEDEGDKENDTHLMYDRSEDKENKVVPRHPLETRPGLGRQSSLFGLEDGIQRRLSMSPGNPEPMSDAENDENNENNENDNNMGGNRRRPFQSLLEEDPFLAKPGSSPVADFAARLSQASPLPEHPLDSPESTLRPKSRYDESVSFKGAPLQPGFSDLFETGTAPKRPLGLSASFSGKNVSLGLTQDVDLQPAFEVGDRLKRQADAVFEKEQGFLWEAANRKSEAKPQELYVNDHGFLTQTRPDVEEPEIYQPSSPATAVDTSGTQETFRTLSFTKAVPLERSPERSPLVRLAKRTRTPPPRSKSPSPSNSPTLHIKKNAFDVLRQQAPRPKQVLKKSEFVAEEAQESDDDEMVAFGGKQKDDDGEEDGEDLDRTLETLVDDQEMGEDVVAADRVLEKFQEHAHEDDLANEKYQQDVVQGIIRKKRRNRGFGIDDSDSDDEEDDMRKRKMRRGLHEPKVAEHVSKLAENPATLPFFQDPGDDMEFAYLQETQPEAGAGEDAEMNSDGEEERGVFTRQELVEKVRDVSRQEHVEPELDPHDISWMDGDSDGETETKVKISRREARNNHTNALQGGAERDQRMHQWAKQEGRSRNAGTGRASGRNAVTGQNARAKAGGGSLRAGAQGAQKPAEARRSLGVKPSVLSVVASDRSTRFGA
ncbi:hypothetical protein B0H14DRAFT_2720115 [Mycena olivaceomarginata]|nr:hypothetical protein B0H14DRAFT_2720115 [Mycena olivaceomarginata]